VETKEVVLCGGTGSSNESTKGRVFCLLVIGKEEDRLLLSAPRSVRVGLLERLNEIFSVNKMETKVNRERDTQREKGMERAQLHDTFAIFTLQVSLPILLTLFLFIAVSLVCCHGSHNLLFNISLNSFLFVDVSLVLRFLKCLLC
jgi:hypothetical protein